MHSYILFKAVYKAVLDLAFERKGLRGGLLANRKSCLNSQHVFAKGRKKPENPEETWGCELVLVLLMVMVMQHHAASE